MIYKFTGSSGEKKLEIERANPEEITLAIENRNTKDFIYINLHKSEIYDLIGCLHSLQSKINKGVNNG